MINLIMFLIFGHACKWKLHQVRNLINVDRIRVGQAYYLQCEICGDVKHVDLE